MQLRPRLNRRFYRPAAGGYLEVSPFNLHCNGPTKTIRFLAPSPNIVGHRDHAGFDPGRIDQILREGRLRPGRFSLSVGLNRTIVPATRDFKVPMARFAEPRTQEVESLTPQIRACLNVKRVHPGCRLRAHAMKLRDRKRSHERLGLVGHNGELAVRLALIGRELREELVRRNSGRGRELSLRQDAGSYFLGRLPCSRDAAQIVSDVKICLVERERLDQRRIVLEDRMDLLRDGAVDLEPRAFSLLRRYPEFEIVCAFVRTVRGEGFERAGDGVDEGGEGRAAALRASANHCSIGLRSGL